MKMAFYNNHPYWGQLGNNGGTQTILKCTETLNKLGHEAYVVAEKDRYTWHKHDKPRKKVGKGTDAVVAVSISDVPKVNKMEVPVRAYFARPIEFWQQGKGVCIQILNRFVDNGGKIFCNSSWQVKWLEKYSIPSKLQYAGIDFDQWEIYGIRLNEDRILFEIDQDNPSIGTLYHKHPRKQFRKAKKLMSMVDNEWHALGKGKWTTGKALVDFYNQCNIWFAPTKLEGFHNVPAEAALCGCLVICMNEPKNGMGDYANDETAHVCDTIEDVVEAIENPDYNKVEKMDAFLRLRIGSRERNMKGFAKCLK